MDSITNTNAVLTAEEKLLIELLVDGELDEPRRKSLLLRLDHIEGGWRFCAVTFLESQCLRETIGLSRTGREPHISLGLSGGDVRELRGSDMTRSAVSSVAIPVVMGSAAIVSAAVPNPVENVSREDRQGPFEPTIIPLKRGGYRSDGSFFRSGGSGGGGTSWPTLVGAMAGGFLLAVLLSGFVAFLVTTDARVPSMTGTTATAHRAESQSGLVARDAHAVAGTTAEPAVRLVTLKSPNQDLNGISVPCVEADAYSPGSLRSIRGHDPENEYARQLRRDGHKVETLYEEMAFPLEDGRTLILPVDTYDVQYETPRLGNFQ